jgi:hypothetical protein
MRMHVMAYSAPMASLLNITLTGLHTVSVLKSWCHLEQHEQATSAPRACAS